MIKFLMLIPFLISANLYLNYNTPAMINQTFSGPKETVPPWLNVNPEGILTKEEVLKQAEEIAKKIMAQMRFCMVRKTVRKMSWVYCLLALLILSPYSTIAWAAPDPVLLDRANQVKEELLKDLEILVNIDSPADYGPGLEKIKDILFDKLRNLGADVEIFSAPKAGHNIVATFKGTGEGKILLMAHADTVFKPGTAAQRPFEISEGKAYGPGVVDDKGSILTGLYALKLLKEIGFQDYARITFLINCDEEVGSPSSRDLIKKLAREHDYAICLEGGKEGDGLVNWRKGAARITVEVKGRASHAGNAPENGANALVELAHQVLQLRTLENKKRVPLLILRFSIRATRPT